jgi:hypothetical protein
MRILLFSSYMAVTLLSCTRLLAVEAAAQDIPQCYVGSQPCGTPEHLYQHIIQCLKDPLLCGDAVDRRGVADARPISFSPSLSASLPRNASTSTTGRPTRQSVLKLPTVIRTEDVSTGRENGLAPAAIDELAGLDPAVLELHDVMPANADFIEHRLGLRRTRVEGIDLRGKIPSPAEIVEALAPRNKLLP